MIFLFTAAVKEKRGSVELLYSVEAPVSSGVSLRCWVDGR